MGEQATVHHESRLEEVLAQRDESHLQLFYDMQALVAKKIASLGKGELVMYEGRPVFYPEGHPDAGQPILAMASAKELNSTAKALIAAVNGERIIRGRP